MSSPAYYMPSVPSQRRQCRAPGYPRVTSSATRPNMVHAKVPDMTSLTRPDTKSTTSLPSLTYQPSYMSSLYKPSKVNALYRAPSGHLYRANKAYAPTNKTNKGYAPPRMAQTHGRSPYISGSPYPNTNGLPLATGAPYAANLPLAPALVNILTDSDVEPITDNASKPTSYIVTRRPQYPRSEGYYSDDDEEPSSEEEGSPASSSSGEVFSSPATSSEEFFSASEDEGACSSASSAKALSVSRVSHRVSPASNYVPLNDAALIASPDDHLIAFGDDYLSLTEDDASMPTKDDDDRSSPEDERSDSEDERSESEDGRTDSEELTDPKEDERHRRGLKHLAMAVEHVRQSRLDARFEEAAKRGSRVVPAMCAGRAPSAKNLPKGEVRTAMVAFIAARGERRAVSRGPGGEAERFEKVDARNDEKFSYSKFAQLHAQRARLDHLQRASAKPHSPVYEQHKASHAEYVQRRALFAQLAHLEARNLPGAPVRHHPAHPDAAYISPRDLALQGPPPISRAQIEWEVREGGPGAEAYRTAMWVQYQQARARDAMAGGA
ncbi:hypothetical protein GGF50DRAFT_92436 [Schizophyllum commune]